MRLIIDGHDVIISKGTSVEYVSSNPFFTKSGEYTLNIPVDLSIPSNAQLYDHIERMDKTGKPINRTAIIESNGKIITKGTEIILSVEGKIAQVQIVAGNAELNYLSSKRENIRDIEYACWYIEPLLIERTQNSLKTYMKALNYNLPAISFNNVYCPLIKDIIEVVVRDAGYIIEYNVLDNYPEYGDLFVVPIVGLQKQWLVTVSTWTKMMPKWSANEFLTEVEKFFNVIFIKNESEKSVSILSYNDYFSQTENIIKIDDNDVMDEHTKNYDVENSLYTNYANVSYKLPDKTYYKYADIDNAILNKCENKDFSYTLPEDKTAGKYEMYNNSSFGYKLVKKCIENEEDETKNKYLMYQCSQFQKVSSGEQDETELKIIPAQIVAFPVEGGLITAPYVGDVDYETFTEGIPSEEEYVNPDGSLNEEIENGISEENIPDYIEVAYCVRRKPYTSVPGSVANESQATDKNELLQSVTCRNTIYSTLMNNDKQQVLRSPDLSKNLDLNFRKINFYNKNEVVDTSVEIVIKFKNRGKIYDPKSIFLFRNKKYYCKELKYKLEDKGVNQITEGCFYRIV